MKERILFAKRLAVYLHANISLPRAFAFMAEGSNSVSAVYLYDSLEQTVLRGEPLSSGLAAFPKQFDSFAIGFIRAGEASGSLPETLVRLADILEKRSALRRKILSALLYPSIVLVCTIGVAGFLTLSIFPKIIPVLQGLKTTLPLSTRILIAINACSSKYWPFACILIIIIVFCSLFAWRYPIVRATTEKILSHVPIFGSLYRFYAITTAFVILAAQLLGGVRIIPALTLVQGALPGILYPQALTDIQNQIAAGQPLSRAFQRHPKLFPPIVAQMIAAGEATGTLRENLVTAAHLYEESLDELTKNLTVLVEPVLMIAMGTVVGFVALAIITPIYRVTQTLT